MSIMYKGLLLHKSHHHVGGMGVSTDIRVTILVDLQYTQACHDVHE